jgi:arylsulfatase A-like enzyme
MVSRTNRREGGGSHRAALLALSLLALLGCDSAVRPNLLLVTVDTLRADRLACYGGPEDVGRALCGIGARGVRYTWAFSTAPATVPAVASLLTSRYPSQHGVVHAHVNALAPRERTLAEALDAVGYDTGAIVSNPALTPTRGLGQGFRVYDAETTRRERNRDTIERTAADTTAAALGWLSGAREPWFLWVHFQDPHGPYDPPGAPPTRDAPGARTLPVLPDHSGRGGIPAYQRLPGVRGVETYEARYRAEIDHLDRELERLLRDCCRAARPVGILITADHGESFGEDGYWFAHGHSVGLDLIRVPLLWQPPGGVPPATVAAPVSGIDVAPTLLAAARVAVPPGFVGAPLPTSEPPADAPRALFAEHPLREAVVTGGLYFARDLPGLARPVPDANSGGRLYPLPARGARLRADGLAPPYETPEQLDAGELARTLDGFRAEGEATRGAAPSLPPAERAHLEALGYLE